MLKGLLRLIKVLNERYIFCRRWVVVEYNLTKNETNTKSATIPNYILARRVTTIDRALEAKLMAAISKMDFHPPFSLEEARGRLNSGYYFIIAELNGEIIGWSWAAIDSIFVPEIEATLRLKNKEAFSFNTYIEKSHRTKGINKMVIKEKLSSLQKSHFKKIWGLIYSWNIASIKSFTGSGWEIVGHYVYLRFFFIKIRFKTPIRSCAI